MPDSTPFIEIKAKAKVWRAILPATSARLPKFIGGPNDAADRLRGLRVAVVGTGSVGGRIAEHCVRAGVAELWLVDPKDFKSQSLLTHDIGPDEIGRSKAKMVGRRCRAICPATRVFVFAGGVAELPLDAFADVDLIIIASDNLAAELEVSRRARALGKPLIHAAVHGETLAAQVRCIGNLSDVSPCVGCGFNVEEWRRLAQVVRFPCDGTASPAAPSDGLPTLSVSSLCALAADLALNQILRWRLTLGASVLDSVIEFCGYTNRIVTSALKRNPACPCDHRRLVLASVVRPLRQVSLAELARDAGFRGGSAIGTFALEGYEWARLGQCKCPTLHPLHRFIPRGAAQTVRCHSCRSVIHITPFFREQAVSTWTLGEAMEKPLDALGAGAVRCVVADDGGQPVLFRAAGKTPT